MSWDGKIEALLTTYFAAHAANDLEAVLALFEDVATVEDPVGSAIHEGIDAVRAFYAATHERNGTMTIERVGPGLAGGDEIVVHVRAGLDKRGSPPAMDVIYLIRLGASGRIANLRAWF